ncbi:hypothetical protein AOR13_1291 [Alteromonas stellipolaris LMG 21856]|nr:hypothetical protein AOR13_1291 [Alteromonas stellipolaris LMG 21856]
MRLPFQRHLDIKLYTLVLDQGFLTSKILRLIEPNERTYF